MDKSTSIRRPNKLANLLERLPPSKFNYGHWVGDPDAVEKNGRMTTRCGTTACALGWATAIPECKLSLSKHGDVCLNRVYQGEVEAGAEAFGISHSEAHTLFIPEDGDPLKSPKYVAKKVRKLVKKIKLTSEIEKLQNELEKL